MISLILIGTILLMVEKTNLKLIGNSFFVSTNMHSFNIRLFRMSSIQQCSTYAFYLYKYELVIVMNFSTKLSFSYLLQIFFFFSFSFSPSFLKRIGLFLITFLDASKRCEKCIFWFISLIETGFMFALKRLQILSPTYVNTFTLETSASSFRLSYDKLFRDGNRTY